MSQPLHAPLEISFDYTRSLGPTLSEFVTALAGRRILGATASDGRVHAPPFEYDPVTGAPPAELVPVGPGGTVLSWTWIDRPLQGQPLDRPFAWALVEFDGAGTSMLHALDAGSPDRCESGMRVTVKFKPAAERVGSMHDIECFIPEGGSVPQGGSVPEGSS